MVHVLSLSFLLVAALALQLDQAVTLIGIASLPPRTVREGHSSVLAWLGESTCRGGGALLAQVV